MIYKRTAWLSVPGIDMLWAGEKRQWGSKYYDSGGSTAAAAAAAVAAAAAAAVAPAKCIEIVCKLG